jgi:hypothetical protein
MDKKTILKELEKHEITRQINNFKSNDEIKKEIIKEMTEQKIPLTKFNEDKEYFYVAAYVFKKNKHPQITISNIKVLSNKVLFDGLYIPMTDITIVNKNEFKTSYATYYRGDINV